MSDSKHTPGPWINEEFPATLQSVHGSRCVSFIVAPHGHGNVADVCDSAYMPEAEARANARLIAAAPELLEALTFLYAEMDDYQRINKLCAYDNQCMQMARAAIAKATSQGTP